MNIKDVKTAFKVADVVLDKDHEKNHIKFKYLEEINDEKGNKLNKKVLSDKAGRVYLIVVNDIIKKIGCSQGKGGIKSTLSFYQSAMQGRPSIRSYGIHLLMKKALENGKKVEIYMIISKTIKATVKGLFLESIEDVTPFREMEYKCKKDYTEVEGTYPEWNFQEKGSAWPTHIQDRHAEYIKTTVGKKEKMEKA